MWRVILFALVWAIPARASESAEVVRFVTWNLQWFPGGKAYGATAEEIENNIALVRRELFRLSPDVVILQEVGSEAVVEELIEPWGPEWQVHTVSQFKQGNILSGQQIAIASRFPAVAAWSEAWREGWAGPPRGFAFARLIIAGAEVGVYGLHLKSNLGDAIENTSKREDAAAQLLDHIKALDESGLVVVAGDFNTDPVRKQYIAERTFSLFEQEGFFWTFDGVPFEERITCPAKGQYPPASFDHVLTKGFARAVAVPVDSNASDHFPVQVDLVIGE